MEIYNSTNINKTFLNSSFDLSTLIVDKPRDSSKNDPVLVFYCILPVVCMIIVIVCVYIVFHFIQPRIKCKVCNYNNEESDNDYYSNDEQLETNYRVKRGQREITSFDSGVITIDKSNSAHIRGISGGLKLEPLVDMLKSLSTIDVTTKDDDATVLIQNTHVSVSSPHLFAPKLSTVSEESTGID